MALKVTVENLDEVQEEIRSFYTEANGVYVLDVESVDDHPDVKNLSNAYQAEKVKRQEQGQKLRDAQDKLEDLESKPKGDQTQKDKQEIVHLRGQLEDERDIAINRASELEKQVYKLTVQNQLDDALKDSGITSPAFQRAAKAMLSDSIKVQDGKPYFDTDMGPLSLKEYVKRWASSSDGSDFVSPPKGGGAKSQGTGGIKPSSKPEEMSLTERRKLLSESPEAFYSAFPQAKGL